MKEDGLTRDCGKVQRLPIYVLVISGRGQDLRAHSRYLSATFYMQYAVVILR